VRACLTAFAFLVAAACASDRTVSYRIARVNGQNLPFTLKKDGDCQHWLLEGFITMPGDRTYTSTFNIDIVCPGKEPVNVADPGISGTVRSSNDTIYFENAAGGVSGFGIINADSLVVQGREHRLTYMRIRE
jgi:hypothetical protein